jgi:hypothetical protein
VDIMSAANFVRVTQHSRIFGRTNWYFCKKMDKDPSKVATFGAICELTLVVLSCLVLRDFRVRHFICSMSRINWESQITSWGNRERWKLHR